LKPAAFEEREPILISPDRHHENVAKACAVIGREPSVYQRAGDLVRIIRVEEATDGLVIGTPTIRTMKAVTAKDILTRVCRFQKTIRDRSVDVKPDEDIVSAVLASGEWPGTRVLNGIIETPIIRPDGTILQTPGYDPHTGFLFEATEAFPRVADAPTHADACRALDELNEIFADFPFADEPSRAAPVAALLTILARPAIAGNVPLFIFDAPTPGSGKSLQTDAIAMCATGRHPPKGTWPGDNDAEVEKILGGLAIAGVPLFSWDNVSQQAGIGGAPIDKYLTCVDTVSARILGRTEIVTCKWRTVMLATGNNVALRGDVRRRVILSRLESPLERPEDRPPTDFRHPDLLGWVKRERPRLVAAGLTLLRGYCVAGRPGQLRKGSFEAWASLVPSAIAWAGGSDATSAVPPVESDGAVDTLADLLGAWPVGVKKTAAELISGGTDFRHNGLYTSAKAFFDDPFITTTAATKRLKAVCGRVVGGKRLKMASEHRPITFYAA
jgi:hypothetical protein